MKWTLVLWERWGYIAQGPTKSQQEVLKSARRSIWVNSKGVTVIGTTADDNGTYS